ncbi:protein mono-ADP-ribosyltransferase PARP14 [Bombina bombina]|uniref:protein mono-ADP-ribosyltransferase PARP14 n=1 Tax=Bombina bombina TaxID=8345 RepID=UPI00235A9B80|nr:protein mono-ADP-ribosyltransferase PARP14 [Bombina bombina]
MGAVRDRVLQNQNQELQLPGGKKLKLEVKSKKKQRQQNPDILTAKKSPEEDVGIIYLESRRKEDGQETIVPAGDSVVATHSAEKDNLTKEEPINKDQTAPLDSADYEVLIENVQENCTIEMLNLLIENISNLTMEKNFNVTMRPEICLAVVTFTSPIDLLTFLESFSCNPRVISLKLSAKTLEKSKSVRVDNLPLNTIEDYLILYFESPTYGGGQVQEVELIPEENAAIVTFKDQQVVKTVLARKHLFGKTPLSVNPYHPLLGRSCVTTPKPLEFPINPDILEFILKNAELKYSIEQKMSGHSCEVTWPDSDCANPVIKLCISSNTSADLRSTPKLVKNLKEEVTREFLNIITIYKVTEHNVNKVVWEGIKDFLSSPMYESVLIKQDSDKDKVFIVGHSDDLTTVEPTFSKLVENTLRHIEIKKLSIKTKLPLTSVLHKIILKNNLEKKLLKECPDVKIDYDESAKEVILCGLKEDVFYAKCEILNVKQELKRKSISIDCNIKKYLNFTDNDELSSLLFIPNNINAMLQIEGDVVALTGLAMEDLTKAENKMKSEIVCKHIAVENRDIVETAEWKSLISFFSEKGTILIEEIENNVLIVGLSSDVQNSYERLDDYLDKNIPFQEDIQVKSMAKVKFLMKERKEVCEDINKNNVKILVKQNIISLCGSKKNVLDAATCIKNVLTSLFSDTLSIDKPGAKKFSIENEDMYVTTARQKFNCLIYLQKDLEDTFTSYEKVPNEPLYQVKLSEVVIAVYKDDLTRHSVDVVVNAANEDLKHIGGLALSLLKAAGPKLQTDCDIIVKNKGKLSAGKSVITGAGNLPCKHVIHTVGPRWNSMPPKKCERLLKEAIMNSLEIAADNGLTSIGIPAVSSGIFGFPLDLCVKIIVESVHQFVEEQGDNSSIKRIHLVDTDDNIITIFTDALKVVFHDQDINTSSKTDKRNNEMITSVRKDEANRSNDQMVTSIEGIQIKVIKGNIQDAKTDVIVNSVGKDRDMGSGGASRALLQKAGNKIQQLLTQAIPETSEEEVCIYKTEGCNLSCKTVIHVVVPQWDNGKGSSEKILRQIIQSCLFLTEKNNWKSMTIPAIGTGLLGFPKKLIPTLMFEEIFKFSTKSRVQHLQEVCFILHPSDVDVIKEFSSALEKQNELNAAKVNKITEESLKTDPKEKSDLCGTITEGTLGVYEMRIGPITFHVSTGDITKEKTDAIVNSTNSSFNLKSGVSKAILDAAGQSVEDECKKLGSQDNKGLIITKQGNLLCKWIIHVYIKSVQEEIKSCVTKTLKECAKLSATTVSFPAIGTGIGKLSPGAAADALLDGVVEFASSKHANSIHTVKVIIFQQNLLNDFYRSMKKKEGTSLPEQTTIYNTVKSAFFKLFTSNSEEKEDCKVFELKENIEPAIFQLCSDNKKNVTDTSSWLENLILKEQHENTITDDWIKDFEEEEHQILLDIQKNYQVTISFECTGSSIKVSGLTRDVLEISNKIQELIKKIRERKIMKREAELCSNLVEWRYQEGGNSIAFNIMTNLELEKAKNENRQSLTIDIKGVKYTVNMELKSAIDSMGNQVNIERIPKHEQPIDLPKHWDSMDNDQLKLVLLHPGTSEHSEVKQHFELSYKVPIIKIERVQNKTLWLNYQIKKESMDTKNGNTNNEKKLFHGTTLDSVKNVNHNGFNRGFAGANAALYGNGTYFANEASYSSSYSKADSNGYKYMYLARVLTGLSCKGEKGMPAPPPKNASDPTDLFDSVTDTVDKPSMYVIFSDIQAYPEYLITFK